MGELILKFGDVKGGDFIDSPEAGEKFTAGRDLVQDAEAYKKNALEVIELFNGTIIEWWTQTELTKDQAKEYIIMYGDQEQRT